MTLLDELNSAVLAVEFEGFHMAWKWNDRRD